MVLPLTDHTATSIPWSTLSKEGKRVIGYDNAEGKGDHRHYGDRTESYRFEGLEKLAEDFYSDIQKYREERL